MRFLVLAVLLILLSGCGTAPPTAVGGRPVSYWVKALQSPDAKLRKQAVFKLGNVGPADAAVYPALIGALNDTDTVVRCEAILALLKFGPAAREAIPALTEVEQHDRDAKVRSYAAKALAKLREHP
jgi:HEAT repeat protein